MKDVTDTYIAKEEAAKKKPVELYHIWRDGGEHWRYTSGDTPVVYDGYTYSPAVLERGSVTHDSEMGVTTLSIQTAVVEDPVLEFIAVNPVEILWISVMRLHRDQDPLEASVVFVGQVKNVSFKGTAAAVECVGFEHFLKMPVPLLRYQPTCNWKLFDSRCGKSKAEYKVTAVVTLDDTGTILSSATFGAESSGYFTGGLVEFGDTYRTIVASSDDTITIAFPFPDLEDGNTVDAYPGCAGRVSTCKDKYDNLLNFLGFPFIPVENPAIRTP